MDLLLKGNRLMRKAITFTLVACAVNAALLVMASVVLHIRSGLGLTVTAWCSQIFVGLTTIFLRSFFKEGWRDSGFTKPKLRWAGAAWASALLVVFLSVIISLLFRTASLKTTLTSVSFTSRVFGYFPVLPSEKAIIIYAFFTTFILPIFLAFFALGEEMGWRGYVLPKLLHDVGQRNALIFSGLLWSTWRLPLVWVGQAYMGFPILGTLLIIPFISFVGVYLGYMRIRTDSIWVTAIAHGTLNAQMGGIFMLLAPPKSILFGGFMGLSGIAVMFVVSILLLYLLTYKTRLD